MYKHSRQLPLYMWWGIWGKWTWLCRWDVGPHCLHPSSTLDYGYSCQLTGHGDLILCNECECIYVCAVSMSIFMSLMRHIYTWSLLEISICWQNVVDILKRYMICLSLQMPSFSGTKIKYKTMEWFWCEF